jgi:hypothetical protein
MTYFTFSRALHLMRYSGAKVRRASEPMYYYKIVDTTLLICSITDEWAGSARLTQTDILANDWEIYNDRPN